MQSDDAIKVSHFVGLCELKVEVVPRALRCAETEVARSFCNPTNISRRNNSQGRFYMTHMTFKKQN